MLLTLSAPPVDFLTDAELKAHLRIDHAYDDATVTAVRLAATSFLDGRYGYLNRALCTQTWLWSLPAFPLGNELHVPLPPLQSVVSVKYFDVTGVEQTLAATEYRTHTNAYVGYLKLKPSAAWPATDERDDAVTLEFVAGYGAPAVIPAPVKAAALLMAGRLYANRGDGDDSRDALSEETLTMTEKRLLASYRLQEFVSSNEQYWQNARAHPHR